MKLITPRQILPDEALIVENALRRAAIAAVAPSTLQDLKDLMVVGICECGCRSLYFRDISTDDYRAADGVGSLANGKTIELMVWVNADRVSALDLIDYESVGELPIPESVRGWEHLGSDAP